MSKTVDVSMKSMQERLPRKRKEDEDGGGQTAPPSAAC